MSIERQARADRIRSRSSSEPWRPDYAWPRAPRRRRPRAAIYSAIELLEAAARRGWPVEEVAEELFDLQLSLARDLFTATLVRREIEQFLAACDARPHAGASPRSGASDEEAS